MCASVSLVREKEVQKEPKCREVMDAWDGRLGVGREVSQQADPPLPRLFWRWHAPSSVCHAFRVCLAWLSLMQGRSSIPCDSVLILNRLRPW